MLRSVKFKLCSLVEKAKEKMKEAIDYVCSTVGKGFLMLLGGRNITVQSFFVMN
jgi:hypothetical protein